MKRPLVDKWAEKLQVNTEATERWMRRLLRAASALERLRSERRRLVRPPSSKKIADRKLDEIPHMAGGGDEFNDEVPI